mmetsp:Transcript_14675/g.33697  ORF Transcript_14675/g.33697 Transcript_14675/m.33697 type:complete len:239 (+) Transcript_14675:544-1260(+)
MVSCDCPVKSGALVWIPSVRTDLLPVIAIDSGKSSVCVASQEAVDDFWRASSTQATSPKTTTSPCSMGYRLPGVSSTGSSKDPRKDLLVLPRSSTSVVKFFPSAFSAATTINAWRFEIPAPPRQTSQSEALPTTFFPNRRGRDSLLLGPESTRSFGRSKVDELSRIMQALQGKNFARPGRASQQEPTVMREEQRACGTCHTSQEAERSRSQEETAGCSSLHKLLCAAPAPACAGHGNR